MSIGNFAAGLAKGAIDTYSTLEDIERRRKESDRQERALKMQEQEFQQRQDERRALSDASQQTYGRVGKAALTGDLQKDTGIGAQQAQALNVNSGDAAFDAADRAQLADTLRGNAQRQGAAVPELPTYTEEQAAKDYARRMYAIDPTKAQQHEAGALALKEGGLKVKALQRDADLDAKIDAERTAWQQEVAGLKTRVDTAYAKEGVSGVRKELGAELKQAGVTLDVVGNTVSVKQGKKVLESFDVKQTPQVVEKYLGMHYVQGFGERLASKGLFKTPGEAIDYAFKVREADRKDRDTDSAIALRDAQGAESRARAGAQTAYARSLGERTGNWTPVGSDSDGVPVSYDRNSGKFARMDGKPVQDPALFRKVTGERNATTVSPEREKAAYAALNKALEYGKPELVDAAKAQYPDVFGEDPMLKAFKDAQTKKNAPPGAAATATAKPTTAAPAPAPAAPQALGLPQRLSAAISADNQSGNRANFDRLATQVAQDLPAVQNQIAALARALPNARTPSERANIQAKIDELTTDVQIMQSIADQRRAALGY